MGFRVSARRTLARVRDELLALLWPGTCAACDQACLGSAFCPTCAATLEPVQQPCPRCAVRLETQCRPCPMCVAHPPPYASAHAVYRYGGALARAIIEMKHGKRRDLARTLAPLLVPGLTAAVGDSPDIPDRPILLTPVPLHAARLRWRGFNQALELLLGARRSLAAGPLGAVLAGRLRVARELLVRVRNTPDLGHAGPAERRRRIQGAFAVRAARAVADRAVILVDDVLTTGATAGECARVLLRAGAHEVRVVALARA